MLNLGYLDGHVQMKDQYLIKIVLTAGKKAIERTGVLLFSFMFKLNNKKAIEKNKTCHITWKKTKKSERGQILFFSTVNINMEPALNKYLFIYPFINHLLLVLIITFMNSRAVSTVELWAEKNRILYYIQYQSKCWTCSNYITLPSNS